MLRLFTTLYPEKDSLRRAEYAECLMRNLGCAEIDEVCLLVEGDRVELPESPKIRVRKIETRPTYANFFQWIGEVAETEDVSVVANTDIWFDGQLALFRNWKLPDRTAIALSRWNLMASGRALLYDHNDSQDAWIFRGKVGSVVSSFPVGVPRCDNRIAAELQASGYCVMNPAFSLKSYHLHSGPIRIYDAEAPNQLIPPPYKYIWPHNLFGPLQTVIYNLANPTVPVAYRIDRRRLARTLPWRILRKLGTFFGSCR